MSWTFGIGELLICTPNTLFNVLFQINLLLLIKIY